MKIKDLLKTEKNWTKRHSAVDYIGDAVDVDSPEAIAWCLVGSLCKCYPQEKEYETVIIKIYHKINSCLITYWNDVPERTFEEIKNLVEELDI